MYKDFETNKRTQAYTDNSIRPIGGYGYFRLVKFNTVNLKYLYNANQFSYFPIL